MSLLGSMRTGVSGMNAQSLRISTVAENIANSSTTGFKKTNVEFETVLGNAIGAEYVSGSVLSHMRDSIQQQGVIGSASNPTDLAIAGSGLFIVSGPSGETLLTRAGAFRTDASGKLVNSAGYALMGYRQGDFEGAGNTLSVININTGTLLSSPSTTGTFAANLPANASTISAENLPSENNAGSAYSVRSSIVVFDNLGAPVTLDLYLSKAADNRWEVAVFDRADSTTGGLPYDKAPLLVDILEFDSTGSISPPKTIQLNVPNGASLSIDVSGMKQLQTGFTILQSNIDGGPPARAQRLDISTDGTVSTVFDDGRRIVSHRIPLGSVANTAGLVSVAGNAYSVSLESGPMRIGGADRDGFGKVVSSSLESSNVDIASELTTMIEAQRNYSANSRVFQTSSELLEVLNRL